METVAAGDLTRSRILPATQHVGLETSFPYSPRQPESPELFDSLQTENGDIRLTDQVSATRAVYMLAGTKDHLKPEVLPLSNAVFCLDCEVISTARGDECSACKSHSLVNLSRLLGGSLLAHKAQGAGETSLFDVTITIELQQMHAKDLSTTVERLTSVIGPRLARDRALFHINVVPAVAKLDLQPSISSSERDAA